MTDDESGTLLGSDCGVQPLSPLSPSPQRGKSVSDFVSSLQQSPAGIEDAGADGDDGDPVIATFVLEVSNFSLCAEVTSHYPEGALPFSGKLQENANVLISLCFPEGKWMGKVHGQGAEASEEPVHGVYTDIRSGNRHYIAGVIGARHFHTTRLQGLSEHTYRKGDYLHQIETDAAAYVSHTTTGTDVDVIMLRGKLDTDHAISLNMTHNIGRPREVSPAVWGASLPICWGIVSDIPIIRSAQLMVQDALARLRDGRSPDFFPTAYEMFKALRDGTTSHSSPLHDLRVTGCLLVSEMYRQLGLGQPAWEAPRTMSGSPSSDTRPSSFINVRIAGLPARLMYSLCSDVPIRPLFDTFAFQTVLEIVALVLFGEQVVLSARKQERLLPWVLEGIRALAGPFMRICPQTFGYHAPEPIFQSPAPFYIGWNAKADGGFRGRHNLTVEEHVWEYSVDTGMRERPEAWRKVPVELPQTFRDRIQRAYNEMRWAAEDNRVPEHSYTVNFVNQGNRRSGSSTGIVNQDPVQQNWSFCASFVSHMEFGKRVQVQGGSDPQFLDLKHGIVALFFVEFVRLVQGYNQFLSDFRAEPPVYSRFLTYCKGQQRLGREDICFLETFLKSQVWLQYLYELKKVQQWIGFDSAENEAAMPAISQEWGLPVALFHELCGRAARRNQAAALERQKVCCLMKALGIQRG